MCGFVGIADFKNNISNKKRDFIKYEFYSF